jgi:hypothetical protein
MNLGSARYSYLHMILVSARDFGVRTITEDGPIQGDGSASLFLRIMRGPGAQKREMGDTQTLHSPTCAQKIHVRERPTAPCLGGSNTMGTR